MKNVQNFSSIFLKVFFNFSYNSIHSLSRHFLQSINYINNLIRSDLCLSNAPFSGYWISSTPKYFFCSFKRAQIHIDSLGQKCIWFFQFHVHWKLKENHDMNGKYSAFGKILHQLDCPSWAEWKCSSKSYLWNFTFPYPDCLPERQSHLIQDCISVINWLLGL